MENKDLKKLLSHRRCYIKKFDKKFRISESNEDQKEQLLDDCKDYNRLIIVIDEILMKNGNNPEIPPSLENFREKLNSDPDPVKFTSMGIRKLDI